MRKRSKIRLVLVLLAATAIAGLGFAWWVHRSLDQLGRGMGEGLAAIADLGLGAFGQLVVIQKGDPLRKQLRVSGNLGNAYQENPAAFKEYAALARTWTNAMLVADATFQKSDLVLPIRSDSLNLANQSGLDAWQQAFCVSGNRETLVVMSAGTTGKQLNCRAANISREKLAGIPRSILIKTDAGYLVLLADRPQPGKPRVRFVAPEGADEVRIYELNPPDKR